MQKERVSHDLMQAICTDLRSLAHGMHVQAMRCNVNGSSWTSPQCMLVSWKRSLQAVHKEADNAVPTPHCTNAIVSEYLTAATPQHVANLPLLPRSVALLLPLLTASAAVAAVTAGAHLLITSSPILHRSTHFAPSLQASTTAARASASTSSRPLSSRVHQGTGLRRGHNHVQLFSKPAYIVYVLL